MPEFQYTARELSGRQVNGTLTAANQQEVLSLLSGRNLFPIQVDLAAGAKSQQKHAGRRVSPRHLSVFYVQLADLLQSGVPLLRSLELLEGKTPHQTLKLVLEDVRAQVADGNRLAEAMKRHERVFGDLAVSMVRAGEEGSFMEDVLKRIASFTEHQEELKSRVIGSMVYPFFLLSIGTVVVAAMMTFFVPKFEPIFEGMAGRGSLPWATVALMSLSDVLQNYLWIVILILIAGGVALSRWLQTEEGRMKFDAIRLKMIGIGPVVHSLAIARFCRILGTLLKNGVPILQSLRIAKDATGNRVLSRAIGQAAESLSAGEALANPLGASGQFPDEVVEMIAVGEEANNLEQVLINVADNMERQTERQLELFVRMLEPILLTFMAAITLFVVVALMLPIMQSSGIL
ncbi:type II secretion system F family protein [Rubinisphaera sp. JC750]|uniref:type II secretion system F family protein n=1 Tax=Rubinisphaera sp. JC750 TaxID=2898658 RepID=UPI001F3CCC8E|nr:type II secretion system F family protein [Rubinisphaera sp. JC750]